MNWPGDFVQETGRIYKSKEHFCCDISKVTRCSSCGDETAEITGDMITIKPVTLAFRVDDRKNPTIPLVPLGSYLTILEKMLMATMLSDTNLKSEQHIVKEGQPSLFQDFTIKNGDIIDTPGIDDQYLLKSTEPKHGFKNVMLIRKGWTMTHNYDHDTEAIATRFYCRIGFGTMPSHFRAIGGI